VQCEELYPDDMVSRAYCEFMKLYSEFSA